MTSPSGTLNLKDSVNIGFLAAIQIPDLLINWTGSKADLTSLSNLIMVVLGVAFILWISWPEKTKVIQDISDDISEKITNSNVPSNVGENGNT